MKDGKVTVYQRDRALLMHSDDFGDVTWTFDQLSSSLLWYCSFLSWWRWPDQAGLELLDGSSMGEAASEYVDCELKR